MMNLIKRLFTSSESEASPTEPSVRDDGRDEKQWVTQGDEHVAEACRGNEAQGWIPIKDLFQSGHDTYPTYDGCRCTVIYRTSDLHSVLDIDPTEGLAEENAAAVRRSRTW